MKPAFSPHQIKKQDFRALKDWVIVSDMNFEGRTLTSGIIIPSDNGKSQGVRPRWGQVYAIGPEQTEVKVGDWICVAHGRWTRGLDIEDETGRKTIRRIDPKDILMVSDYLPSDDTMSDAVLA